MLRCGSFWVFYSFRCSFRSSFRTTSQVRLRHLPCMGRPGTDSMSDTPSVSYFRAALPLMSLSSFSRPALPFQVETNQQRKGDTTMRKGITTTARPSSATYEVLEAMVRQKGQEYIQEILEDEVEAFLGRKKSERIK